MRSILTKSLIGALTAVLLMAGTAASADVLEAKVPFPFVVNGKTLPAGQYTIERAGMGESVLLIRGEHGNDATVFVGTRPAGRQSPSHDMPALQFKKYENQYKLSAVWESADEGMDVTH
jgi:hypothetical protein